MNNRLYTYTDIQNMLNELNRDTAKKQAFLCRLGQKSTSLSDKNAIISVIRSGWYEDFCRYDSDVCEQFIRIYEDCSKEV